MPTLCVDFDGVIASYKHWEGKGVFGEPLPNVAEALEKLQSLGWIIIIHTTRSETHLIEKYLNNHKILYNFINYNPENIHQGLNMGKPLADVYLDDRGLTFEGRWLDVVDKIINFQPWFRK